MKRRPLNISAALAIAVERQVEEIIANAKRECALRYPGARNRSLTDPAAPGSPGVSERTAFEAPEADRGGELRFASADPASGQPSAAPSPKRRSHFWGRLRSLFTLGGPGLAPGA